MNSLEQQIDELDESCTQRQLEIYRLQNALRAIATMQVNKSTDHAQLSALCIAIARAALKCAGK